MQRPTLPCYLSYAPIVSLLHDFYIMENDNMDKSVVNLSTFKLNEYHTQVLQRGLKFCPTPPAPNTGQLRQDLDRLHNRMRQISFFDNKEKDNDLSTSFSNANIETPLNPMGTNLPFKHRKFKSKS